MPDNITDTEAAAIAAYRGHVQRIPRGISGLPKLEWDGTALRYSQENNPLKGWRSRRRGAEKGTQTRQREYTERRDRYRVMCEQGWTVDQIAESMGFKRESVVASLRRYGLTAAEPPKQPPKQPRQSNGRYAANLAAGQARVEAARAHLEAGLSVPQMAEAMGCTYYQARRAMRKAKRCG